VGSGFEPAPNPQLSDDVCCIYVNCQEGCAASALHPEFLKWLDVALDDTDLRILIKRWPQLSKEIRKAIALITDYG
jgi:hypothetical protein